MNEVAQRILALIHEKRVTYAELEKMTSISRSAWQRYARGITPSIPMHRLQEIAAALQTTPAYLMGWEDVHQKPRIRFDVATITLHEQTQVRKYRECDERGKDTVDRVLDYEHYRSIGGADEAPKSRLRVANETAAAGFGSYLNDSKFEEIEIDPKYIPTGTSFGVRISGNSMEPEIPNGCIAFVRACPAIDNGQIGIFALNNEGYCKRIDVNQEHSQIRLLSTNPDYAPIKIKYHDDLRTYGQVLGYWVLN